ncbi:MAG: 3,4-dihydroxy-2-butanone-4-phosphate synthase [Candidatus Gracilibacteria bacterium]|jgi:3,4-dihydroxy 2-butanone 4-phosphate synthase/GTP cyclohydrolase II|nr:3,4-dihydroxy-2-butanone-4-phosphate synthase [Candidatus Gracilibacteria bacterium]
MARFDLVYFKKMENVFCNVEEALEEVKKGNPIIIVDDEDRENEGDLMIAGEMITAEKMNFLIKNARGIVCVPISSEISKRLNIHPMTMNPDKDTCNFAISVDHKDCSTGVSAKDRAMSVKKIADDHSVASDFIRPGHIYPLNAKDGGVLERCGHTEASLELCELTGFKKVAVICEITNDDGTMARVSDLEVFAKKHGFKIVSIEDIIKYKQKTSKIINKIAETKLPTEHGNWRAIAYKEKYNDKQEHLALTMGDVSGDDTLVRIHSSCLTGDVFSSLRCDCKSQLEHAKQRIISEGRGVIIYLNQEGRGIGLANKIRAYKEQDNGLDTVEANEKLGFKKDQRNYIQASQILKDLNVNSIKLMSNNPQKIKELESMDIKVTREPIEIIGECNKGYIQTKKDKLGHLFS